jgi:predicted Zn-dependent protease with MMP-like domain
VLLSGHGGAVAGLTDVEFEALVDQALAGLPEEVLQHLDNVAVTVAEWPSPSELKRARVHGRDRLFGLYQGVPLTRRGVHYNLVAPDRITVFRGPLLAGCHSRDELREQIRRTVVHEIAHHLGISEARLGELGY